jgi:hypothetical protein
MGIYSDTNVEKSTILLLKIEQNGGFFYIFAKNGCQGRSNWGLWEEGVKLPLL